MLQFYFLSVLLNFISGLIFIYVVKNESDNLLDSGEDDFASESKKSGFKEITAPFLGDKTLQLVVGILSGLTGLMKLLSPIQYDIIIVGDLIPALAGIISSAVLLLDWYQDHSELDINLPESIEGLYKGGRKYLGIFCIIAAFLHFIFPRALFL